MPRRRMRPELKSRLAVSIRATGAGSGSDRVAEQVRSWIFDGSLRDGDVVSQEDLAELLGLSRIPVRDALISLAAAGWIHLEPGVGARAIGLDAASVRDSLEIMGTIWSLLARSAVERRAPTDGLLAAAANVKAARSAPAMAAANGAFLDELRVAADSPRLDAAFRSNGRIVPGDFFSVVPGAVETQRTHVPAIARAIAAGDVERARVLAMALHRRHAQRITRLLTERGVLDRAVGRSEREVPA